jgi:hypothetical protein
MPDDTTDASNSFLFLGEYLCCWHGRQCEGATDAANYCSVKASMGMTLGTSTVHQSSGSVLKKDVP